jgi:hypothetical protein
MKKRKMSALQRKYFSKRSKTKTVKVRHSKRRVVTMARKKHYRSYARRGMGGMKSFIIPIGAGVADRVIDQYSPIDGIGSTLVGFIGHNEIVKNIGLYKVGYSVGGMLPIPGITANGGGGF